jgi:tetratricopeptide (TPR) repeat protein
LRRLTDEKGKAQVGAEVLGRVVGDLKIELRDQRKAGDKAGLEATIARFDVFLQALGKDNPKLVGEGEGDHAFMVFLATTYASLGKNAEAAKLFAKIPQPKFDAKKKLTPQEQREMEDYWLLQATYARSLREAKQYAEARKVVERILKESRSAGRFQAEKEMNHLLEEEGDYGRAVTAWSDYLENPGLREILINPRSKSGELRTAKELYFDGYWHFIFCCYQFGKAHKVEAKRKEFVGQAGSMIAALETNKDRDGWEIIGPRLEELLNREPMLREAYLAVKGK